MKITSLLILQIFCFSLLFGQNTASQDLPYDPHDLFTQQFNMPAGNPYRSANGSPGPMYWQNSASYLIHATLSEKDTSISGDVTITYTNNSPDKLDYLWFQLDQNIFSPSSRSVAASPVAGDPFGVRGNEKGGYQITDVTVTQGSASYKVQPVITDTRMQLRLKNPLDAKGGQIRVKIDYSFLIPAYGASRMGRLYSKTGVVYQIAQWYPRILVYDDVEGWNTLPYMGFGEFYCDYGDYEYFITAPSEMIVYGSGDLLNPKEVLTAEQIKRLAAAANSDKTTTIVDISEIGKPTTRPASKGNLTWHFKMKNTRDVAFAAGKGMIWDAARINLPSGRKALAMSAYPPESMGDSAWSRSTEYLKKSIEIYSEHFFEYPWNNAVSSAGVAGGMEYPGMIFNLYSEKRADLFFLISHEIGHNWYPMIVGSNERRYMWQDEGLNTYINYRANELFNNGEYNNDPAFFKKDFFASLDYNGFMHSKDPLMTVSDAMDIDQHFQFYTKTAYGLNLLRNVVVGKDRFDYAFRKYTETWAYKHPTPYDLFRNLNNGTGEDLNWFWKQWFFTTWKLDQAVGAVEYIDNDPSKGSLITIENKEKLILPVIANITESNGKSSTVKLPVEIWQRGGSWTFKYESTSKIRKIILDPDGVLPDTNRQNNVWEITR